MVVVVATATAVVVVVVAEVWCRVLFSSIGVCVCVLLFFLKSHCGGH